MGQQSLAVVVTIVLEDSRFIVKRTFPDPRNTLEIAMPFYLLIVLVVGEEFCTFTVIGPGLVVAGCDLPRSVVVTATIC